jgi:anti-anti-sigma factor
VSDTVFQSSSSPGTTEGVAEGALFKSVKTPIHASALVQPSHDPNGADAPLKIRGEQTIRTADDLHKLLAEYLDRAPAVVLDLSEVHECDTAALQLIYALRQSVVQRKQRFGIAAVSPAITETAASLGLRLEDSTAASGPAVADSHCEAADIDNGI